MAAHHPNIPTTIWYVSLLIPAPPPPRLPSATKHTHCPPTDWSQLLPTCHGHVPAQAELNGAHAALYHDLTEWCVLGPQRCECVDEPENHGHALYCIVEDRTLPTWNRCYRACNCEAHDVGRYVDSQGRVLPLLPAHAGTTA